MVKLTPEPESKVEERPDDLSDHAHRQLIGYVGLVLPLVLIVITLLRDGVERWRSLTSISAYYYTGAVAAFVGARCRRRPSLLPLRIPNPVRAPLRREDMGTWFGAACATWDR